MLIIYRCRLLRRLCIHSSLLYSAYLYFFVDQIISGLFRFCILSSDRPLLIALFLYVRVSKLICWLLLFFDVLLRLFAVTDVDRRDLPSSGLLSCLIFVVARLCSNEGGSSCRTSAEGRSSCLTFVIARLCSNEGGSSCLIFVIARLCSNEGGSSCHTFAEDRSVGMLFHVII